MALDTKYKSAQDIVNQGNGLYIASVTLNAWSVVFFIIGVTLALVFWLFGLFDSSGWEGYVIFCSIIGGLAVFLWIIGIISAYLAPIVAGLGIIGLNAERTADASKQTVEINEKQLKLTAYFVQSNRKAHSSQQKDN